VRVRPRICHQRIQSGASGGGACSTLNVSLKIARGGEVVEVRAAEIALNTTQSMVQGLVEARKSRPAVEWAKLSRLGLSDSWKPPRTAF